MKSTHQERRLAHSTQDYLPVPRLSHAHEQACMYNEQAW